MHFQQLVRRLSSEKEAAKVFAGLAGLKNTSQDPAHYGAKLAPLPNDAGKLNIFLSFSKKMCVEASFSMFL